MRAETQPQYFDLNADLGIRGAIRYDSISVEEGRRPIGFRFFLHIINIRAKFGGRELVVTGEADSLELAYTKARSELVERTALISSPDCEQAETSNGWAAHPSQEQAKMNAIFELIERDAVLSQWYSANPFFQIPESELPVDIQKWITEELSRSEYPELLVLISTMGIGPSVSCIFKNAKGFGVSGHATRATLGESIDTALAEACRAAHSTLRREYWGDTLKLKRRAPGRVDPGAHSVFYAYHEPFPAWITGSKLSWTEANAQWTARIDTITKHLDDFRFQVILESPLFVGFAKHPLAFDLRWGSTSENEVLRSPGARRIGLNFINKETHIVS